MNDWQPIETAPIDGTHLLLFREGFTRCTIGWFYNNAWHWDGHYEGVWMMPPTHWMSLPKPPNYNPQEAEG